MPISKEKKKELQKVMDKFFSDHEMEENPKIGFLSENEEIGVIKHLETGNIGLDTITNGGLIAGKVNILYGAENTGKSTLLLDVIAHQHKINPDFVAALCDNEKVFDREYAISKGIDLERLIVGSGFTSAEQAYDFCNDLTKTKQVDMLVVDTIQALSSESELRDSKGKDKSTASNSIALIPRLLSQFLRMYTSQTSGNVTLVLLSQVRLDLGSFMPSAKKTGGKAIDHYNVLTVKLTSQQPRNNWPYTVTEKDAPPKSFALNLKLDKAKMKGRYDGNKLVMYFREGIFDDKFNVLAISKELGLFNGKTITYEKDDGTTETFKGKGFVDSYNTITEEPLDWLRKQIPEAYTKLISFKKEEVENEGELEESIED